MRVALQKKRHQECVTRESFSQLILRFLSWVTNDQCALILFIFLSRVGQFTLFARLQMSIFLCLQEDFGRQTVKPTFPGASRIPNDSWGFFSRVELLVGNLDESEAPAPHIASGDLQKNCSSLGYSPMASTFFA